MFHQKMLLRKQELTKEILTIKKHINKLPKGKLICAHNGIYTKWYISDGHKKTYIPKKNRKLAEDLAMKKYLSLKLDTMVSEVNAIDFYLRHYRDNTEIASALLKAPGYQELLSQHFRPVSEELKEWMNAPYERNTSHPENLTHKCMSGNTVRSKSEMLIDMSLCIYQIPFRYENPLILDGITFYPDFTIRHPRTGQFYYWEHFGRVDDPEYLESPLRKLRLFSAHGIYPSINLITTYETKDVPLSAELVENIIEYYFL